jgi:intergrase/recombinase
MKFTLMTPEQIAEKQIRIDAEAARVAALPEEVKRIIKNVRDWRANAMYEVVGGVEPAYPMQ